MAGSPHREREESPLSTPRSGHRRARAGSVAVGYLGASWIVLQVLDVIRGILPVPTWLAPGLLGVLSVGFVVVVSTAWIQADPETTRRELSGEIPGDWQIAPRDAFGSIQRGRLPHLTWGRTAVAGVVALSILFGGAGFYVVIANRSPAPASGLSVAAMPFTTTGPDLQVYREGMVELLATNLDGLGDIRAIASRTVLARWDELGNVKRPDLDAVLKTARATGASHALVGNIVEVGTEVRISSQLFDLRSGVELPIPTVQGPASQILSLVDRLSITVTRALLGADKEIAASGSRLASLTTSSVPALRLYLQAEALYRRGAFEEAIPLLDRAVEADPSFGLAVMRRAQAFGWLPGMIPEDSTEAARRAIETLLPGMSRRDATLAGAGIVDFAKRDPDGVRQLREFVKRYPDDAEGWFQLSDFIYHLNRVRGGTIDQVLDGFGRAADLAPRFAPYYIHATEAALLRRDSVRATDLLTRYRALAGEDTRWKRWTAAYRSIFRTHTLTRSDSADAVAIFKMGALPYLSTRPDVTADLAERFLPNTSVAWLRSMLRAGRWGAARTAVVAIPQPARDTAMRYAVEWIGAFGLDRDRTSLIVSAPIPPNSPDFWNSDPHAALQNLLKLRDDGTGADPLVIASLAMRAGDTAQADSLLNQESWREFGPAATYRLAKLYEATGRHEDALRAYARFLEMWRTADADLPPVREAKAKLGRN